ncbi:hypothetical protein [Gaopeijia maritima]|uniref:N-formylglutamate amidohydrolase n=1 Tax=Gaopeijia maritima TaxID=3119007 RepID=A0ABU9E8W3_9BACT
MPRLTPFFALVPLVTTLACEDSRPVEPVEESMLRVVSGDGQSGLIGVPLSDSLVIEVRDENGPRSNVSVTFTALGGGTFSPPAATTDAAGRAMALWIPGEGADSVEASALGDRITASATGARAGPTTTWMGRNDYVEYRAGTLPLVLSAPHGGTMEPAEIPDRSWGTTVRDIYTDELAYAIADALEARTGERPHLIVSHLHRRKLDPNREIVEAAQDNPRAQQTWREFQALIEHASDRVEEEFGEGYYIDLHGHGHEIQRIELGYLLGATTLGLSDQALDAGGYADNTSVPALVASSGAALSVLLRGPDALGTLLEDRGLPTTPSAQQPGPGDNPFFSGGYNTRRHGSFDGGPISGVQIELNYFGVRDTPEHRALFAERLADALAAYLPRWYPSQPTGVSASPPR